LWCACIAAGGTALVLAVHTGCLFNVHIRYGWPPPVHWMINGVIDVANA